MTKSPHRRCAKFSKDKDKSLRITAIKALGEINDPRAEEALRQVLSDEDSDVRFSARCALQNYLANRIAEGASLETLLQPYIKQLSDPNPLVREETIRLLGWRLNNWEFNPPGRPVPTCPWRHLYPNIYPTLIGMLGDENKDVRQVAFTELVMIMSHLDYNLLETIRQVAKSSDNPIIKIETQKIVELFEGKSVLVKEGGLESQEGEVEPEWKTKLRATGYLGQVKLIKEAIANGEVNLNDLIALTKDEKFLSLAVEGLLALGGEGAIQVLADLFRTSEDWIGKELSSIRYSNETAKAALVRGIEQSFSSGDPQQMGKAIQLFKSYPLYRDGSLGESLIIPMLEYYLSQPDSAGYLSYTRQILAEVANANPEIFREQADLHFQRGDLTPAQELDLLKLLFSSAKSMEERGETDLFAHSRAVYLYETKRQSMTAQDKRMMLGFLNLREEDSQLIAESLMQDPDTTVQARALEFLYESGDTQALDIAMTSPNATLRQKGIAMLIRSTISEDDTTTVSEKFGGQLANLALWDPDVEVRSDAISALSSLGIWEPIYRIVLSDSSDVVRHRAVINIAGQLGKDPRAELILRQIGESDKTGYVGDTARQSLNEWEERKKIWGDE